MSGRNTELSTWRIPVDPPTPEYKGPKNCEHCRFRRQITENELGPIVQINECHRHAPALIWPAVKPTDFCGDFEPREIPPVLDHSSDEYRRALMKIPPSRAWMPGVGWSDWRAPNPPCLTFGHTPPIAPSAPQDGRSTPKSSVLSNWCFNGQRCAECPDAFAGCGCTCHVSVLQRLAGNEPPRECDWRSYACGQGNHAGCLGFAPCSCECHNPAIAAAREELRKMESGECPLLRGGEASTCANCGDEQQECSCGERKRLPFLGYCILALAGCLIFGGILYLGYLDSLRQSGGLTLEQKKEIYSMTAAIGMGAIVGHLMTRWKLGRK